MQLSVQSWLDVKGTYRLFFVAMTISYCFSGGCEPDKHATNHQRPFVERYARQAKYPFENFPSRLFHAYPVDAPGNHFTTKYDPMPYPITQETAALPLCNDSPIPRRINPTHTVDKSPAETGFLDATACTHLVQTPSAKAPETKATRHDHIQILIDLVECVNRISMASSSS